jgi:hypothetical protein
MSSVFALIALFAAVAAEQPCRAAPRGGALDFWLGEWTVTSEDGTAQYGGNSIEMAAEGCAVFERWLSASGGEGYSLFAFDARNETWEQTWVTGDTSRPGGLKRKAMIASADGGAVFEGQIVSASGEIYLDRTTLTPLEDGRVRQLIEISTDGGHSWRSIFDGYYSRRK